MKKLQTRYENPNHSPGYQLWRVSNVWQRHMRQALKDLDLTHVQFVLLAVTSKLCEAGEPVNQAQIAEAASTDKMMTSQVLRALEEKSLVTRTLDSSDGRAMLLSVTDAGYALVGEAIQRVEQADREFFGVLGDDEKNLAGLLQQLWR